MGWWEAIVVGVLVSAAIVWLLRLAVLTLRGSSRGGCGCGCGTEPAGETRMRVRELVKVNVSRTDSATQNARPSSELRGDPAGRRLRRAGTSRL